MALGERISSTDQKVLGLGVIALLVAVAGGGVFALTGWQVAKAVAAVAILVGVATVVVALFRAWLPRNEA